MSKILNIWLDVYGDEFVRLAKKCYFQNDDNETEGFVDCFNMTVDFVEPAIFASESTNVVIRKEDIVPLALDLNIEIDWNASLLDLVTLIEYEIIYRRCLEIITFYEQAEEIITGILTEMSREILEENKQEGETIKEIMQDWDESILFDLRKVLEQWK